MSYQPQTEAATSRFLNVEEAGKTLRIHFNDCGQGDETVVLLPGPPGCYWLGEFQPQYRSAGRGGLWGDPAGLSGLGQERLDR